MVVRVTLSVLVCMGGLFTVTAHLAAADAFSSLLERQGIEAFSNASSRGDQATIDRLTDVNVIFSNGDGNVQGEPKRNQTDALATLLQQQTREPAAKDVADPFLSVNEDGVVSLRRDARSTQPFAMSNWLLHRTGDVAVSSYVASRTIHVDGATLTDTSLAVETWIDRAGRWTLMATQAIPLHADPAAITLPPHVLDGYVGTYTAGPGFVAKITRAGDALAMSTNGGDAVPLQAELQDVFFTPGTPPGLLRSRDIFEHDTTGQVTRLVTRSGLILTKTDAPPNGSQSAAGKITSTVAPAADLVVHRTGDVAVATFIHDRSTSFNGQVFHTKYRSTETWIKRGPKWTMLALQSLELPTDPPAAAITVLPGSALNDYLGSYTGGSHLVLKVSRRGNALTASIDGAPGIAVKPEVRYLFFTPGSPRTSIIFRRDGSGRVTTCLYERDGRDLKFTKVIPAKIARAATPSVNG